MKILMLITALAAPTPLWQDQVQTYDASDHAVSTTMPGWKVETGKASYVGFRLLAKGQGTLRGKLRIRLSLPMHLKGPSRWQRIIPPGSRTFDDTIEVTPQKPGQHRVRGTITFGLCNASGTCRDINKHVTWTLTSK